MMDTFFKNGELKGGICRNLREKLVTFYLV